MKRLAWLASLCWCLTACSSLQFESLPTGKLEACDQRLVGDWVDVPEPGSKEKPGVARLTAGCSKIISLDLQTNEVEEDAMDMQFLRVALGDFLVEAPDATTPSTTRPAGYTLVRYEVQDQTLRVWRGDAELGARLIGEAKMAGLVDRHSRSEKSSSGSLLVHVYGNSAELDKLLSANALFTGEPQLTLKRASSAQTKQLDKALRQFERSQGATKTP